MGYAFWMLQNVFKARKFFEKAGLDVSILQDQEKFSIKEFHVQLWSEHQKVPGRRLTCNNHGEPRWIFILYVAILERLYTRSRDGV